MNTNAPITSATNAALKHLAKLIQSRRYRREQQQIVLEGAHLLTAFLDAQQPIAAVYIPQHRRQDPEVQAIIAAVPPQRIILMADAALSKITSLTQADDLIGIAAMPEPRSLPQDQDCVVLEAVQDPGNVGTILRSALAAGIADVVLNADCADVWSPKVLRAGMGAHAGLHIHQSVDLLAWRQQYTAPVYATTLNARAQSLYQQDLRQPAAWVFGNEGSGVSHALQHTASQSIIIPMAGQTESLNVAMAATVCLFEQLRQRQSNQP